MPAFSYPVSQPALANEGAAVFNASELLRTNFAVAGTPLGSMTQLGMIAAAAAECLSGANIGQQFIDVRQFGQWQDGVNCTQTLVNALIAAGSNTQAGTPYPLGIQMPALPDPLGGVLVSAGLTQAVINVPTGVTLRGAGWKTHLTVDPSTVTVTNGQYHVLDLIGSSGRIMLEEFQLDGNKANINQSLVINGMVLIYASDAGSGPAVTDLIMRNLFVHDGYASAGVEGFGILAGGHTGFLGTRVLIEGCWGYNITGSGISVSGPNPPGSTTSEYIVANCFCFNNTYQGITWFQTQYGTEVACHCVGNTKSGTNIEYANNIQIIGGRKRLNGFGGVNILGNCSQIHLNGVECIGNWNGTGFGEEGEISLNQDTIGGVTAMPQSVYINNCLVTPNQGPPLISNVAASSGGGGTTGQPSACTADDAAIPFKGIFVTGPDVEKWNFTVPGPTFNQKYAPTGLVIRSGASGGPAPNQGGHPSTWTLVNITVSAAPSGALSTSTAKTFTQTAANSATSATTVAAMLLGGHRYRIRYRFKVIDANATWEFGAAAGQKVIRLALTTNDFGVWFEGEFIITVAAGAAATSLNLVTVTNTASASALGVDYVTSELLPFLGGISGS